jgi:nucleoside-diphosphate-sugar epimerase
MITEDSPIQPDSVYGGTKAESEAIVQAAAAAGGYGAAILRPSNIFGIGMPGTSLFRLFTMIDSGLFCFVGRLNAMMNYVHVDNVATALALCGSCDGAVGRIYNLSDQMPIEHLVAIVADEIGARRPTLRLPETPLRILASALGWLPGMPIAHRNLDALTQRASYASDRIRQELAYNPTVTLETGLRELVRNWKQSHEGR